MEMISSFLSGLANVTPWVVRPVRLTSSTLERMTLPDFMMAMIWSSSSTITAPTREPRPSASCTALTPKPLRPCSRYSLMAVRLAKPSLVTTNRSLSESPQTTSMSSSSSPSRNFMPCTPAVWRPIGRSCSSLAWNFRLMPSFDTRMMSSSALHSAAPISSSAFSPFSSAMRRTAIRPP